MINLDDLERIKQIDTDGILHHIDALPEQFERAWQHAHTLPLPDWITSVQQVVIAGMGGSAIGGDLLTAALANRASIPITTIRGYELPAWVQGEQVLVIASSYSGNTEETLSAYTQAAQRSTHLLGITTGSGLAQRLAADGYPAWTFPDEIGHPRAAIGWSFGLLLGLAARAGWVIDLEGDVAGAISTMQTQRQYYQAATPIADNPTKRQAGQLVGRMPVIVGGGIFEPVARRWKTQLNENSDVWAAYEPMPEMNHNAVVGIAFPQNLINRLSTIFITSPRFDHPRVALRHQLTSELMLTNGIMVDRFEPMGDTALAQMMHAIQFGDYVSFYLAMAYDTDPADIQPIRELKQALADFTQ